MNETNIDARLRLVMASVFHRPADTIDDTASIDTVREWDSLSWTSLVLAVEHEFAVKFDDEEMFDLINFKAFRSAVQARLNSNVAASA